MPYRLVVSSVRPIRVVPIAIDDLQPTWERLVFWNEPLAREIATYAYVPISEESTICEIAFALRIDRR
jgi:hypothetical protein